MNYDHTTSSHFHVHPLHLTGFIRGCAAFVDFLQWVENSRDALSVLIHQIQEIYDLADCGILDHNHMLGEVFQQGKETPLCIEPSISVQFFLDGLKWFDNPSHAEIVVELRTVQSTDHEIDNAEVIMVGLNYFIYLLVFSFRPFPLPSLLLLLVSSWFILLPSFCSPWCNWHRGSQPQWRSNLAYCQSFFWQWAHNI